jgi:hypothetical protein
MKRLLLLILLLGIQVTFAENRHSGIIGQSLISCLRYRPGPECPPSPFATTISVSSDKGRLVETVETDNTGLFVIYLKPGSYTLLLAGPPPPPPIAPRPGIPPTPPPPFVWPAIPFTVEVEHKDFAVVTLLYPLTARLLPPYRPF